MGSNRVESPGSHHELAWLLKCLMGRGRGGASQSVAAQCHEFPRRSVVENREMHYLSKSGDAPFFQFETHARLGFDLKILDSGFALPLARQHKRNKRRAPAELPSTGTSPAERGIACLNNLNESGRLCTTHDRCHQCHSQCVCGDCLLLAARRNPVFGCGCGCWLLL